MFIKICFHIHVCAYMHYAFVSMIIICARLLLLLFHISSLAAHTKGIKQNFVPLSSTSMAGEGKGQRGNKVLSCVKLKWGRNRHTRRCGSSKDKGAKRLMCLPAVNSFCFSPWLFNILVANAWAKPPTHTHPHTHTLSDSQTLKQNLCIWNKSRRQEGKKKRKIIIISRKYLCICIFCECLSRQCFV